MPSLTQAPEDANCDEYERKISPETLLETFFLGGSARDQVVSENWTYIRWEKGRI